MNHQRPPKLKYLFEAVMDDGTVYTQNERDASVKEPPKLDSNGVLQGKNCHFDIREDKEALKISMFSLFNEDTHINVDLNTGVFSVNGLDLLVESEPLPALPEKFKLIYHKRTSEDQNITYALDTGEIKNVEKTTSFTEFFIGWECVIEGKTYQQKIAIA